VLIEPVAQALSVFQSNANINTETPMRQGWHSQKGRIMLGKAHQLIVGIVFIIEVAIEFAVGLVNIADAWMVQNYR
jgi:hypothetical protein